MILNDKELQITLEWVERFKAAFAEIRPVDDEGEAGVAMAKLLQSATKSQIETMEAEIARYKEAQIAKDATP